jgi:hypothetical protein
VIAVDAIALGLLVGVVLGAVTVLHMVDRSRARPTPPLEDARGHYKAELDRLRSTYAARPRSPVADLAEFLDRRADA